MPDVSRGRDMLGKVGPRLLTRRLVARESAPKNHQGATKDLVSSAGAVARRKETPLSSTGFVTACEIEKPGNDCGTSEHRRNSWDYANASRSSVSQKALGTGRGFERGRLHAWRRKDAP